MATGEVQYQYSEHSWYSYWVRWQTPVCFLIAVSPAAAAAALLLSRARACGNGGGAAPSVPRRSLWAPCFRGLPAVALPLYRALAALATSAVLWAMLRRRGLLIFYFYTQWTFLLVIIYFLIGTVISAHGCWVYSLRPRQKPTPPLHPPPHLDVHVHVEDRNTRLLTAYGAGNSNNDDQAAALLGCNAGPKLEDHGSAGTWGYSMQIIYQTCGGAVMLTDVVFWCLLVPFMSSSHFTVNLLMGCMHSLNLLFLLIDTLLNSMPFPWFGMTYFILWSCTYVIFQWILHACGFSW